jgi:ectoine hydroxylase-related dioxygenase (phytanoyl-CoA dioxygenase family)
MQTEVTAEQIEQFRTQGFVLIQDFLDADELEHWRIATEEAVRLRLTGSALNNQGDPTAFYAQVFTQCLHLRNLHPPIAELLYDERLGRMAGGLAGVDGVRVWQDQALIKQPYANHTSFHFDDAYWSFYSRQSVSCWVALDDATLANGCLWYLPGTHLQSRFELVPINENLGDIFKHYPEWKTIAAVPCPCRAGSLLVHNAMIAHGAGVNLTPRHRRAMTWAYMPDGATFNGQQSSLPAEYFQTLRPGDVLDDDAHLRLVWRRN